MKYLINGMTMEILQNTHNFKLSTMIACKQLIISILAVSLLTGLSYSVTASPLSIFSQCLEKHLASKGNKKENTKKLRYIQDLCRNEITNPPQRNIELSTHVINDLEIEAGFGWGIFSGSIYNANPNLTITKLIVLMIPIHGGHHMHHTTSTHKSKEYIIETNLKPLSKSAISVALDEQDAPIHAFDWRIVKAFGYKQQ